jgi:hypothetical protein
VASEGIPTHAPLRAPPGSGEGARIRCHSRYGARDWVSPHPRQREFRHPVIRPGAAAWSGGAGVTAEVTRRTAARIVDSYPGMRGFLSTTMPSRPAVRASAAAPARTRRTKARPSQPEPGRMPGRCPDSKEAWARSGAWPPRAQTGKARLPLGPSTKIMPVDSYSTLGRSCEPAFKWISGRTRRALRGDATRWRVAGPRRAARRRAARSPDREVHPRSSRPGLGPDPPAGGRGRNVLARPAVPNSDIPRAFRR